MPSVSIVSLPSVVVVSLAPVGVPLTPVIVAVVISAAAGMDGGMTGMDGTGLRRSNSKDGYHQKTQFIYGFHSIYYYSAI
jgi:hypothetical protein